ncbi:MAG: hypothetical protein JWR83_3393 [Aeromicrobium sp.]|nr:hypothetical protein [Aeromicrobium sp.]
MTSQTDTTVRHSIDVTAPPDRAFEVFTAGIDRWWTRAHHVQSGELKEMGIDPHVGGRMWEENDAGEVCTWGHVTTWEPPHQFAFTWLIGGDWGIPAPDAPGSQVTVTFTPTDAGTRVELVHDRLDVYGEGWENVRNGVDSDAGWPANLRQFAALL